MPNLVTAVLADYRGFDTMFETVVIFSRRDRHHRDSRARSESRSAAAAATSDEAPETQNMIVVQTCRLVIPIMQLFALYVIAHGHHSPGGGFQGGVMFGASFILWAHRPRPAQPPSSA